MIGEVKFFTQPHRLFFFLAMVSGFLGMVLATVLWVGDGQRAISPLVFHPFVMVFLFFPALFFGFLLTKSSISSHKKDSTKSHPRSKRADG